MDALTFAIEVVFALVFVAAFNDWLHRRDPLSRDVAIVFGAVVGLVVADFVSTALGSMPPLLAALAVVTLLGQPLATLRLASDLRPVPRPMLIAAAAGWILTSLPFAILGAATPPLVGIVAVAVFVTTEVAAAGYLTSAAQRRTGVAGARMWTAAIATALFALSILAAGVGPALGAAATASFVAKLLALLAALGYLVAFVPPGFVRRSLQASAAYRGLRELLAASGGDASRVWQRYLAIAAGATGATSGLVVVGSPEGQRIAMVRGLDPALVGHVLAARSPLSEGVRPLDDPAAGGAFGIAAPDAREGGARFGQVVLLGGDDAAAALVLFATNRSLFADEDRDLLAALGQQAAALAELRESLVVQERLTAQLGETVEALRSASKAKSDFLASMSHELRTPLNAIIGFSDLMHREELDHDGNALVSGAWVEHIRRGGAHLVELINDVLDLARVESGRLELDREPISVLGAVSESVAGLRPLADRKGLTMEVSVRPDECVLADQGRLRQILYNLLSNAIKFTPDGGRILVEGRREGQELHLAVQDSGVGIKPADLARVFEEFRQFGASGQRSEGSGLGLAITRRLVEAHDGRITAESTVGQGSRFTIILPLAAADAPEDREAAPTFEPLDLPAPAGGPILLVEDDLSAVSLLQAYLEPEGYRVVVAASGEQALEVVPTERPAAVLLDVNLPGIDGWEVLRRFKADPGLRSIPIVILTVVDAMNVGLALGAADYIVKPIDRDALLASLARLSLTPRERGRPIRVLTVDDEPAALEMLAETLRPAGYDTVRAITGMSAIQIARAERPDLVICDLLMPDLDGFGVVAALKADPATAEIPIIILTGHDMSAAEKRRLNGKVVRIFAKGPDAPAGLRAWLIRAEQGTRPN